MPPCYKCGRPLPEDGLCPNTHQINYAVDCYRCLRPKEAHEDADHPFLSLKDASEQADAPIQAVSDERLNQIQHPLQVKLSDLLAAITEMDAGTMRLNGVGHDGQPFFVFIAVGDEATRLGPEVERLEKEDA